MSKVHEHDGDMRCLDPPLNKLCRLVEDNNVYVCCLLLVLQSAAGVAFAFCVGVVVVAVAVVIIAVLCCGFGIQRSLNLAMASTFKKG